MNEPSIKEIKLMVKNLRDQMTMLEAIERIADDLNDQVNGLQAVSDVLNCEKGD